MSTSTSTNTKTESKPEKQIDYLTEDAPIAGQSWVCVSFMSPEGIRNCTTRGLKIRGVYATQELASKRAKELQELDPAFDIFVGEIGKWLAWDPDPYSTENQVHPNEELNKLAQGYKENREKADKLHKQRVDDAKRQAGNQKPVSVNSTREKLRRKLEERKKAQEETQEEQELEEKIKSLKEQELEAEEKRLEEEEKSTEETRTKIQQTQRELQEKTKNLESVDERLKKITQLYDKLSKKQQENKTNA